MARKSQLKIFETHGFHPTGESGDQIYGYCPFSGKDDKLYINRKTLLWDSKTAHVSGNVHDFLRLTADRYEKAMTPELWQTLADDRGLPVDAFKGWNVGWNGQVFTIPVREIKGKVVDIRMYRPGTRTISTGGVDLGLLGAERLPFKANVPVYVCEGEWDTMALAWLMKKVSVEGVVVGLPGAGVFKPEWIPWLAGRRVHTLYDHDEGGEQGEHIIFKKLKTSVQLLTFTHWLDSFPEGFDVRDWIIAGAVKKNLPKKTWRGLTEMFRDVPRRTLVADVEVDPKDAEEARERGSESSPVKSETAWKTPPTLADVHAQFKKWLFLDNTDGIDIMLATAISQQIDGEPVWMFMVGPPGSAKTETLSSLSWVENIYMTSSVTPHSLISGANWKDNGDPSLIPKLDGKVMVIKDFTSILSMPDNAKDEIFGILRDAYDGKCGKEFGNGVVRRYESRFTVLAAVTPSIYALSSGHTALGERFLKFGIGDNLVHRHEDEIIERAITNINQETIMRDELADVVRAFLGRRLKLESIAPERLPVLPDALRRRVIALARFGARMRGTVTRDSFRNDIVTSRPSAEVGSRLGKQLAKLCKALAVIHGRSEVSADDYRLVKKVMLDTIPQRTEDLIRNILLTCPGEHDTITTTEISSRTRYPLGTVSRIMQDLTVLDIAKKVVSKSSHHGNSSAWSLSAYIRDMIHRAGLYQSKDEIQRPSGRLVIRVKKRVKERTAA